MLSWILPELNSEVFSYWRKHTHLCNVILNSLHVLSGVGTWSRWQHNLSSLWWQRWRPKLLQVGGGRLFRFGTGSFSLSLPSSTLVLIYDRGLSVFPFLLQECVCAVLERFWPFDLHGSWDSGRRLEHLQDRPWARRRAAQRESSQQHCYVRTLRRRCHRRWWYTSDWLTQFRVVVGSHAYS